jgi:hypothetical protein
VYTVLYYIHPPTLFPNVLPPPTDTNSCSPFIFINELLTFNFQH